MNDQRGDGTIDSKCDTDKQGAKDNSLGNGGPVPGTGDEHRSNLRRFVAKHIRRESIGDTEKFISSGMVNSMFVLQLVRYVEKTFGIVVENEDIEIENFDTVAALTALIERKTSASPFLRNATADR